MDDGLHECINEKHCNDHVIDTIEQVIWDSLLVWKSISFILNVRSSIGEQSHGTCIICISINYNIQIMSALFSYYMLELF